MRALEKYLGLSGLNYNAEKKIKHFQERVKATQHCVDSGPPHGWEKRQNSPRRYASDRGRSELIAQDNMLLAQRIFNIMEAPGMITEEINDTRHLDCHPGTMNFKHRLEEAQRIHAHNMIIASRLNNVRPYYGKSDLYVVVKTRSNRDKARKTKSKKSKLAENVVSALAAVEQQVKSTAVDGSLTHRSDSAAVGNASDASKRWPRGEREPDSARKAGSKGAKSSRPNNVLLEYTKVQDGRVLDVAVIKEPFRDRYAVFGIDIDDGQRYELRLTSEEVSSILDGDMLVTTVDNVEVWMALLNKVSLKKVEVFAKLPTAEKLEETIFGGISLPLKPKKDKSPADPFQGPVPLLQSPRLQGSSPKSKKPVSPVKPGHTRPSSQPGSRAAALAATHAKKETTAPVMASKTEEDGDAIKAPKKIVASVVDADNENTSATKIQAVFRGKKQRTAAIVNKSAKATEDPRTKQAVIKVQAIIRGALTRKRVPKMKDEKEKEKHETEQAAIKVQATIRGALTRKKVNSIGSAATGEKQKDSSSEPRAIGAEANGKSPTAKVPNNVAPQPTRPAVGVAHAKVSPRGVQGQEKSSPKQLKQQVTYAYAQGNQQTHQPHPPSGAKKGVGHPRSGQAS